MQKTGIRRKIVSAFMSVVIVLVLIEIVISVVGYNISNTYHKIVQNLVLESSFAQDIPDFITSYNELLSIDHPTSGISANYNTRKKALTDALTQLDQSIRNPESAAKYIGLKNFVVGIIQDSDRGIAAKANGDDVTAQSIYDQILTKSGYINQNTVDLILAEMNYANTLSKQTDRLLTTLIEVGFGLILIMVGGVFYFVWSFSKRISQPLVELEKLVHQVQNGELSGITVDPKFMSRNDEIGSLSTSFNVMAKQLAENISEVEHKTHELGAERDRAQAIVSSMGEGLLVVDKNSNLTIINPTAEKLLNIKATDFIGKPWSEVATTLKGDKDVPEDERTFLQTLKTGKVILTSMDSNHFYKTNDGKTFPVASITAPLKSGDEVVGAVKVFRDVTEEKGQKVLIEKTVEERTAELTKEKAKLSASISSLSLGFILVDQDGNILIMNPAVKKLLNLPENLEKFPQLEELLKGNDELVAMQKEYRANEPRVSLEKKDIFFNDKYFKIYLSPIFSKVEGKELFLGTVILIEDMTEAKVMERSKDEFFSIASHELRTPLTAIRGNTSMILDMYSDKVKDKDLLEMLTDINASSVQLIEIVNDFLNVSRLEQGKMEFKKDEFDVVSLVQEVIGELDSIKTQKSVKLKVEKPVDKLSKALADKNKTKEVMVNLIGNALKFTEKGSVSVSVSQQKEFLKLSIQDTGRGIPAQLQSLLFRKFQQAGSSLYTRDTTKGTGLGLYISKLMVEGMGGTIALEKSEENVGSTFVFTLHST